MRCSGSESEFIYELIFAIGRYRVYWLKKKFRFLPDYNKLRIEHRRKDGSWETIR